MSRCTLPFAALVFAAAIPSRAADGSAQSFPEIVDCRYGTFSRAPRAGVPDPSGALTGVALPDNDLFRPLLADQREPRFYADYRRVRFRASQVLGEGHGNRNGAALGARGRGVGVWGRRSRRG